ncbi:MAG: polymer-forming cytoskeletal protein [Bacteroidales bacterium]|nr:polymer-forming cytoskeletal protein [Bacteroidales bacterium]
MAWGNKKETQMSKTQEIENKAINIIGAGTRIIGEITSTGDIRIDGYLEGNIEAKGRLVVGTSGHIKGTVSCRNADVSGKMEGKITVNELLSVKASATLDGDIITSKLAIDPGAIFTGTCKMNEKVSLGSAISSKVEKKGDAKK